MALRGVNHIGVTVRDLDATVAWYREMLDIEPTFGQRGNSGGEVDTVVQVEGAVIDMALPAFTVGAVLVVAAATFTAICADWRSSFETTPSALRESARWLGDARPRE